MMECLLLEWILIAIKYRVPWIAELRAEEWATAVIMGCPPRSFSTVPIIELLRI